MGEMGDPDGMAALEHQHTEGEEPRLARPPTESDGSVHDVVQGDDLAEEQPGEHRHGDGPPGPLRWPAGPAAPLQGPPQPPPPPPGGPTPARRAPGWSAAGRRSSRSAPTTV